MTRRLSNCLPFVATARSTVGAMILVLALGGCSAVHHNNSALLLQKDPQQKLAALPRANPLLASSSFESEKVYALASTQEGSLSNEGEISSDLDVHDPIEGFNRVSFGFNRGVDTVAIRPLSKVYGTIVPGPIRYGFRNILNTLELPGDIINYTLQGDGANAGNSFKRLLINTTLGLGGFFDTADHLGVAYHPTDFGLTLQKWGLGEGAYVVTPLLGPSSTRDSLGRLVDIALYPATYIGVFTNFDFGGAIARGVDIIDVRHRNGALLDNVVYNSPDPYITLRSTYIQRRRAQASGNVVGAEGMDDALPVIVTSGS